MREKIWEINPYKRILFTAAMVAISSQFYFNFYSDSFRISSSVIVLSILTMTLCQDITTIKVCTYTSIVVFFFRGIIFYLYNGTTEGLIAQFLPNCAFYIFYGFIFTLMCENKFTVDTRKLFFVFFCSDFLSNLLEISGSANRITPHNAVTVIFSLAVIAFVRSLVSWTLLLLESQYRTLLQKEEHERRYQRLYMMTGYLKNEIYFMKKNSEEIENIMGNAYRLYEQLTVENAPDEIKKMSLDIAKDVHEIKKDYIRIISGIEKEINEDYDTGKIQLKDIFRILENTTRLSLQEENSPIKLYFSCRDNYVIKNHYEVMTIVKNLVNNAQEAIENANKGDSIYLTHQLDGDISVFCVKDNGPGIAPRHRDNIFRMGYSTKFDKATGNIYRGVGLSGVKSLVEEKLGGTITVESSYGEGAVFTVKIPQKAIMED